MRSIVLLAVLSACVQSSGDGDAPPAGSRVESFEWPGMSPPKMDMLFVIDGTPAMAPYVDRTEAMLRSIDQLWTDIGGYPRPDLHVAVVSADGALGGHPIVTSGIRGSYLIDENAPDLLTRVGNHDGTIGETLAAMGAPGTSGLSDEPLAMARMGIENLPGFMRPDAYLAIAIVSAHDDASAANVDDIVAWAKGLKTDPNAVIVSAVYPASSPRLDAFVDAFPNRGTKVAIAAGDYANAMTALGLAYKVILSVPCLTTPLDLEPATVGEQYDCSVELELRDGTRRIVPQCPGENCWSFHPDPVNCPDPAGGQIDIAPYRWPIMPTVVGQCVVGN